MNVLTAFLVGVVAALHLWLMALEMFMWDTPTGHRLFHIDPEFAAQSKTLAANQGLYNGFLAAGLIWGLVADQTDVVIFFLACVLIAGLYGAATVNRRVLLVQTLPALLAFGAVVAGT